MKFTYIAHTYKAEAIKIQAFWNVQTLPTVHLSFDYYQIYYVFPSSNWYTDNRISINIVQIIRSENVFVDIIRWRNLHCMWKQRYLLHHGTFSQIYFTYSEEISWLMPVHWVQSCVSQYLLVFFVLSNLKKNLKRNVLIVKFTHIIIWARFYR